MDTKTQIKAVYFDELLTQLHSLHNMYMNFSNSTDNIMASSAFLIIAKDIETLLNKFDDKEGMLF